MSGSRETGTGGDRKVDELVSGAGRALRRFTDARLKNDLEQRRYGHRYFTCVGKSVPCVATSGSIYGP